eukprot:m.41382 g.41382  ORF g.41382 m.41382 type:complete len:324 (+) comp12827_c0_seq3:94-1065(+)
MAIASRRRLWRWCTFVGKAMFVTLLSWTALSLLARQLDPPLGTESMRSALTEPLSLLVLPLRRMSWIRGACLPPAFHAPDLNIAFVFGSVPSKSRFNDYESLCEERLRAYVRHRPSYHYLDMSQVMISASSRFPNGVRNNWAKLNALQHVLRADSDFDWVVWMDRDVYISNVNIRFEQVLAATNNDTVIVISRDDEGINSGVFALRNTDVGRRLLNEWMSYRGRFAFPRDQKALRDIYNRRAGVRMNLALTQPNDQGSSTGLPAPGFVVLRQCSINSTPFISLGQDTFMYGDFAVHFYAMTTVRKSACVRSFAERGVLGIDCL